MRCRIPVPYLLYACCTGTAAALSRFYDWLCHWTPYILNTLLGLSGMALFWVMLGLRPTGDPVWDMSILTASLLVGLGAEVLAWLTWHYLDMRLSDRSGNWSDGDKSSLWNMMCAQRGLQLLAHCVFTLISGARWAHTERTNARVHTATYIFRLLSVWSLFIVMAVGLVAGTYARCYTAGHRHEIDVEVNMPCCGGFGKTRSTPRPAVGVELREVTAEN